MRACLVILVATLAAMTLAGCSVGLPPDVAGLGYIDRSDHVAMNVPAGWQAREFTGQVPLVLTAPGPDEPGRPNVSVTVVPGWRHLTLEDMVEDGRPGLKRLTGFQLVSEGPYAAAGARNKIAAALSMLVPRSALPAAAKPFLDRVTRG